MTEILRHHPQNPLPSSSSFLYQTGTPSKVAPFHERTTSLKDYRAQSHNFAIEREDPHQRPILSNYSSSIMLKSPVISNSFANYQKQSTASSAKKNLKDYIMSLPKAPFLPTKTHYHREMKTLVLDMDETLLHASTKPVSRADNIVRLSDGSKFYIIKRPYLDEFLEQMAKIYEVVIYTAGDKEYATAVIDEIDKKRHISYILHRDHCLRHGTGAGKDLSLIGRNLREVIFIDNLEENLRLQRENGLKISDFYNDPKDDELKKFIPFLQYVSELADVRPVRKLHADFITKQFKRPQSSNSETKQRSESTSRLRASHQRTDSAARIVRINPKVLHTGEDELNHSTSEFGHYLPTPVKKETTKNENTLSKSLVLSPPKESLKQTRFEERMNALRYTKLTPSNQTDEGKKTEEQTFIPTDKAPMSNDEESRTENRIVERFRIEKQTIVYARRTDSGTLIEGSNEKPSNPSNVIREVEKSPLLEELYDRITKLEQKLKSKCIKIDKEN
mgnify:FL=1